MKDTEDSKQPKEVGCCDKKTEDKYFSFILVLANSYFLMRKKYILNLDQFSSAASLCCRIPSTAECTENYVPLHVCLVTLLGAILRHLE